MVGLLNRNPYGGGLLNQPLTFSAMYPPSTVNAQNPLSSYSHLGKPMPPDMAPTQIVKGILGGMGNLAMQAHRAMPWGGNDPSAIGYDPAAGTIDPGVMIPFATDVAGMATTGSLAAPAMKNATGMGIRAYHGSPHDVDRLRKGSSGNYGDAIYFHEQPVDAERYRPEGGKVYEADINAAKPFHMDEPVSVEDAERILRAAGNETGANIVRDEKRGFRTGSELWYWGLGQGKTQAEKAAAVRSAGFDAIVGDPGKEITGVSKRSKEIAVFDNNIIDILKKYGIAGLTAGGAGAAMLGGTQDASAMPMPSYTTGGRF